MKPLRHGFTLIELLVVIAIIGILAGLLFPAVNGTIDGARKAQAKNDAVQIATAVAAYETEYGTMPGATAGTDFTGAVGGTLLESLMGTNPRAIVFIEVPDAKKNKSGVTNGNYVDPWGGAYQIVLDADYDNSITAKGTNLRKKVAVWNTNANTRRLVTSWE